jgi:hypothetical protein
MDRIGIARFTGQQIHVARDLRYRRKQRTVRLILNLENVFAV